MDEERESKPQENQEKGGWVFPDLSEWPKEGDALLQLTTDDGPAAIQIVGGVRQPK